MKLGVFTPVLNDKSFIEALDFLAANGIEAAELGVGGFPGNDHCDPDLLLADNKAAEDFRRAFEDRGIIVSAFSAHGNPVHPDAQTARAYDDVLTRAILLAEKMGVPVVNTFSGCPGDCPTASHPNWVTAPWPPEFLDILDYQWNEVLIPYWREKEKFAKAHNVKIAFELHPGFCVYNTETMLRLREATGENIGANLDPSHLVWQGMDPVMVIRELGDAIFHFHAKDTKIDKYNMAVNGVLDTKHYSDELHRSWIFRSVGYGMDVKKWKEIVSALRTVGYDYVISIEHEDSLFCGGEGLMKAIRFLKDVMAFQPKGEMWWA